MLMGRSGLSPVMVGRSEELASLRARVDGLAGLRGLPPVVVVSGEAGVGKTRLLRELAGVLEAADPPVPVLVGHAEEGGDGRPFGLLVEALGRIAEGWAPLPERLQPRAHALGHVLAPHLAEHPPTTAHEHAADELLLAAVEAVRHEVGAGPAVLVFEDLHWADAESIALFVRLATAEDLPALVVGTFRPEDFDRRHPLARALPALERHRSVTHLALGRLGDADLAQLLEAALGRRLPAGTVASLHRRTQGNPFFVEELVAAAPDLDEATLRTAPLPWNAAEAVLQRVDDLDALPRQVLEAAAVLGGRVPFDRLATVTGLAEDTLIAALRLLVDRGLLREEEADVFAFRHALTREAVAGQLLGREQRRLHRAALAALDAEDEARSGEERGAADLAAVARHAAGAGEWGRLAETALVGAPRLAREGSARQGLDLAELALDRCAELSDGRAMALHAVAATAAWQVGALESSLRHGERWRAMATALDDPQQISAALRHLWRVRFELGDRAGADVALDAAQELAGRLGPSDEHAWLLAYVSQRHMLDQRHEEALDWAERALALAAEVGVPEVVPYALVNKGTVLTETPGREQDGLAVLEAAKAAALERHDGATAARAINNAVSHLLDLSGDIGPARELLGEWELVLDRYGQDGYRPNLAVHATNLAMVDGDRDAARRALDRIAGSEDATLAGVLFAQRALIEAESGDPAAALASAPPLPDPAAVAAESDIWTAYGVLALAVVLDEAAVAASALAVLRASRHAAPARGWLPLIGPTAVVLAAGGPAAADSLAEVLDAARRVPLGPRTAVDEGLFALAEGALLARADEPAAAVAAYHRAEEARSLLWPAFVRAERHAGLARCLAALGSRDEAADHAASAVSLLARWPGWRREEVTELHRRLSGVPREVAARPGELTPREREVLTLVAEGLSNREIGERLYITTKTAAVHVSNILAKLGAASRTEAAAWALRSGLMS